MREAAERETVPSDAVLIRVLNNSAIMVQEGAERRILLGRGIGFGRKLGDPVDVGLADETFVPESGVRLGQLSQLVTEIPLEIFTVARHAVDMAESSQGIRASQGLLVALADHLHFAVERARQGTRIDFPLKWEIEQLYPVEAALGREAVAMISREMGVAIDPEESTALAMHFVNAQFAQDDVSRTVEMTRILSSAVEAVGESIGEHAVADQVSVARFVTHLRYLWVRLATARQIQQAPPLLRTDLQRIHPEVGTAVSRVRQPVESGEGRLTDAEVSFLELHVARLAMSPRPR